MPARLKLLSVLFTLLTLYGCASVDLNLAANQPAPDWIYLHPNAKVGDKAVWNNPARKHHRMLWEVVGRHGDDFEVTLGWQDEYGSGGSEQSGLLRHFIVGPDGAVKRAFARNYKTGGEKPMRVSASGETISKREMTMLKTPQVFQTAAGSFKVDRILNQHYHYRVLVTTLDTATVEMIDPSAPFGVVNSIQDIDIGGLFFVNLVSAIAEFQVSAKSPYDLYQTLRGLDISNQVKQSFELMVSQRGQ